MQRFEGELCFWELPWSFRAVGQLRELLVSDCVKELKRGGWDIKMSVWKLDSENTCPGSTGMCSLCSSLPAGVWVSGMSILTLLWLHHVRLSISCPSAICMWHKHWWVHGPQPGVSLDHIRVLCLGLVHLPAQVEQIGANLRGFFLHSWEYQWGGF